MSTPPTQAPSSLGAFSVSLSVKDLKASIAFYEKLGFDHFGGAEEHRYAMLKNGDVIIGLFQGLFEGNILTFNPGWDQNAQDLDIFTDIRDVQSDLKNAGLDLQTEAEPGSTGPASFTLLDPDGNAILIDQHR